MYIIEDSFVYQVEKTEHFEIKAGIGQEKRVELISEDDVGKLYECQKFDLSAEKYVLDEDNAETVEIDGKEYKADKGRITVPKELSESEAKVKELEELLNNLGKQLSKEKIEGIKKDKVISELGRHESKMTMELMKMKNEVNAIKQTLDKKGGE
jgi:hypothetical protein